MTLFKALLAQFSGLGLAVSLMLLLPALLHGIVAFVLIQCIAAAIFSKLLQQPSWWIIIHLFFFPAVIVMLNQQIPAEWYLVIVVFLTLIFWGTVKGDVPLFLSSGEVALAVIEITQQEQAHTFGELGAGVGSVTIPLARRHTDLKIDAFELAPIPWLINSWRSRNLPAIKSYRKSLWSCEFGQYDIIFAFLSPAVMPTLGEKVRLSMRPGTLFISSSFPAPDWEPEFTRQVNDRRKTMLYCYRVGFYLE